jgi:hypothetical protein
VDPEISLSGADALAWAQRVKAENNTAAAAVRISRFMRLPISFRISLIFIGKTHAKFGSFGVG